MFWWMNERNCTKNLPPDLWKKCYQLKIIWQHADTCQWCLCPSSAAREDENKSNMIFKAFNGIKHLFTIMYHEPTVITFWQKASHFFHLFCLSMVLFLMKHLTNFINADVECVRLFWHCTNTSKPSVDLPYVNKEISLESFHILQT